MTAAKSSPVLPVLDLRRFGGSAAERQLFVNELRSAAHRFGGFYVTGHGLDQAVADQAFALSQRFFDLPEREKLAIDMANSPHFRGYTRVGWERTRGLADWREQIDIGAERPVLPAGPDAPAWARLQGPNQWPESLPELKPAILHLQDELTLIVRDLLRAVALSLGQAENEFDKLLGELPTQLVKLIRYPGRDQEEGEEQGQGVGPHKDSGLLTLVLQHERGGLQVETEDGWLDIEPVPGTFVVNVGELLELASNGYYRASVHQVVSPPAGDERFSIAFFLGAQLDARVPVFDLPEELAAVAQGPEHDPQNPLYYDVGVNALKGRLRSHPDVAERHYADLLTARNA